jgi:uncharacterized membrane protein required for colicin V production
MGTLELGFYGLIGFLAFIGLINGFLKEVVGLIALGAALVGSYFLQSYVLTAALGAGVDVAISSFLQANLFAPGGALDLSSIFQSIFNVLSQAIAGLNLPASTLQPIQDIVNAEVAQLGQLISDYVGGFLLSSSIYLVLFLVILLIANLILGALVKVVKKIKILGLLDRLLGLALGAAKGLVVVEVVLLVLIGVGTILNVTAVSDYLSAALAQTDPSFSLLTLLYDFTRDQLVNLGLLSPP